MNADYANVPSPCFVLEEARLRENLTLLGRVQDESGAKVILALKGFALFNTFPLIRARLPGCTVSSPHELRLAREEFGGEIHACAPVYRDEEMDEYLASVSHISFNSLSQWSRFKSRVNARVGRVSPGIRVNPEHSEVGTALYDPARPGSRLGVTADELDGRLPDGMEGLHFHTLCECGADALARTWTKVEERFGPALQQAKWLNLGGGHLITREGYDVDGLIDLIRDIRARYDVEVFLEPGAAVVWRTGVLVSSVLDRIERRGVRTLMLDVSFAAHMPDCLEMPYKPEVRGARDPAPDETGWRLGGTTCLAGDELGAYVFEQDPDIGARIVFEDMMHYTVVKTTLFNGVPHPSLGLLRADGTFELLCQFGYEDYRNRLGGNPLGS